jgi:hypothetical protein
MPALFAYLIAVSLLLGGGYMSLHWLAAPDTSSSQRLLASKRPTASKYMAEKSDPDVAGATWAERRSRDPPETERIPSNPTSEETKDAASKAPHNGTTGSEDNTKVPANKAEDVPPGGCTPIGLTAQGQLVFPMQCQVLLERHRGSVAPQDPVPTNSIQSAPAQKEHQAAEPARPLGDENTGLSREESHSNKANAKAKDISPSGEAKPGSEKTEPEVSKETEDAIRNMRASHTRDELKWFNPLTFR